LLHGGQDFAVAFLLICTQRETMTMKIITLNHGKPFIDSFQTIQISTSEKITRGIVVGCGKLRKKALGQ
jgi:hypothetical protein